MTDTGTTKQLLSARDIARTLATTEAAVRAAVAQKKEGILIPKSVRLGRRRMWRREDVEAFLAGLSQMSEMPGKDEPLAGGSA